MQFNNVARQGRWTECGMLIELAKYSRFTIGLFTGRYMVVFVQSFFGPGYPPKFYN